jgi:hypothetical protein
MRTAAAAFKFYSARDIAEYLAAMGTLTSFDDFAEDLKAAMRLHRSAHRRQV